MPSSAIIGKSAIAYVLGSVAKERPIRHIFDLGAGCGTYRRLLGPFVPQARWTAVEIWEPYIEQYRLADLYETVHVGDATMIDFSSLEEGGAILFGDLLDHIPLYQAGELVAAALERFDIAVLSLPVGEWPAGDGGGNPHQARTASWFKEDLYRRFAATLAGVIHHDLNPEQSISVAFLGRTEEIRTLLEAKAAAFQEELARAPDLAYCGLDFDPNYLDPRLVSRFQDKVRRLLTGGMPVSEDFLGYFNELVGFLEIGSLADAGCGDFSWMEKVSGQFPLYFGLDRDASLIAQLDERFGARRGHFFAARDMETGPWPKVDAILCRDLFEENSVETVSAMLARIKASGARYLLASTTPGAAAPADLSLPPFNLPPPFLQFPDDSGIGKLLGAWRIPEQA